MATCLLYDPVTGEKTIIEVEIEEIPEVTPEPSLEERVTRLEEVVIGENV